MRTLVRRTNLALLVMALFWFFIMVWLTILLSISTAPQTTIIGLPGGDIQRSQITGENER